MPIPDGSVLHGTMLFNSSEDKRRVQLILPFWKVRTVPQSLVPQLPSVVPTLTLLGREHILIKKKPSSQHTPSAGHFFPQNKAQAGQYPSLPACLPACQLFGHQYGHRFQYTLIVLLSETALSQRVPGLSTSYGCPLRPLSYGLSSFLQPYLDVGSHAVAPHT